MTSRSYPAILSNFDQMMSFVREQISKVKFSSAEGKKFELAIEEALVNVIHYAYKDSIGEVRIDFKPSNPSSSLTITISDSGAPFDPSAQSGIKANGEAESLKEGGLGLLYIHRCVDDVKYEYLKGKNTLSLMKKADL